MKIGMFPLQERFEGTPSVLAVMLSPGTFVREILAGLVTALALVPEVVSFSFISGVDPKVALFASITLGLVMSVLGGRPAMVTAAAGSIALVIGPMVKLYGVRYILPTIVLAGIVQIFFGASGLARIMRFVPRSVMIGFVNALGILIFAVQVPHVIHGPMLVYVLFLISVAIMLIMPRFTVAVPAPLVAIIVITAIVIIGKFAVPDVGSEGSMSSDLPHFTQILVPLNLETLQIIWPTALSVAFVGLLETLLTAKLVDELTGTPSHKGREAWALGVANIAAGFFGGIAGCAMIGQTVVNVKIGRARSRVSTVAVALVLLLLVTELSHLMAQIPLVALAAVMMIVALKTANWHSLQPSTLRRMPIPETIVMAVTVAVTVITGNLAIGVVIGVLLAMVLFARRTANVIRTERTLSADGLTVRYDVHGPLFFGSCNDLVERFSYSIDPKGVSIDLTHSQIWDASSVAALDSIKSKYSERGATVGLIGLDQRSAAFHKRLTGRL